MLALEATTLQIVAPSASKVDPTVDLSLNIEPSVRFGVKQSEPPFVAGVNSYPEKVNVPVV